MTGIFFDKRTMNTLKTLRASLLCLLVAFSVQCHAQSSIRKETAGPLQAAQQAMQDNKPEDALAQLQPLRSTELNPTERLYLDRVTAAAAMKLKNFPLAIATLESLLQRSDLTVADRMQFEQALVSTSISAKDYPRIARGSADCLKLGCDQAKYHLLLVQALSLSGDNPGVIAEMQNTLAQADAAKKPVPEAELRLLAGSQLKLKDEHGYYATLNRLLADYPSKDYWADLLARVAREQKLSPRMELDVYRLMAQTDNLEDASDYLEMAKLALKAGLPAEAQYILGRGMAAKLLSGGDADKLLEQAKQRNDEDQKAMAEPVDAADGKGWAQLADLYASGRQWGPACQAYAKAEAAGAAMRPDALQLHYGIALFQAGQKSLALEHWQKAGGEAKTLADLWRIVAR